MKLPPP